MRASAAKLTFPLGSEPGGGAGCVFHPVCALMPVSALGGLTVMYPTTFASRWFCFFSEGCRSLTWIVLVRAPSFMSSTSRVAGPAEVRRMKESWSEIGEAGVSYCFGWA